MSRSARIGLVGSLVLAGALVAPAVDAGAVVPRSVAVTAGYAVRDLGTLGGAASAAVALSATGQVVGWAETTSGARHAVSWDAAGSVHDLGTLGGATSSAAAVNDLGVVVGSAQRADGTTHAFRWTASGGMVDLGTLGGTSSSASDVNRGGLVVGSADRADGRSHAVLWAATGAPVDLGTLGGPASAAAAVNDSGQVAGRADADDLYKHPFRWDAATGMTDLVAALSEPAAFYWASVDLNEAGQVAGVVDGYDPTGVEGEYVIAWDPVVGLLPMSFSLAAGGYDGTTAVIDDAGRVAGTAYHVADAGSGCWPARAFRWDATSGVVDLGTLGGCRSWSLDVTSGVVVGASTLATSELAQHAFVWQPATGMRDLGTLGGSQSQAVAVSTAGRVAGSASTSAEQVHAVVWDPPARSVTLRATDVADTYVNRFAPTTAFGRSSSLAVGGTVGYVTYLRFVVPAAPAGRTLVSATLRMRATTAPGAGTGGVLQVRTSGKVWSEVGTRWITRPAVGARVLGRIGPVARGAAASSRLDVRALVPGRTLDLAVIGTGSDSAWFWSRDYARASYRPVLELVYR